VRLDLALKDALGKFYAFSSVKGEVEGVISTRDKPPRGKVASALLEKAQPWTNASFRNRVSGAVVSPQPGRWLLLERRLSKLAWLDTSEAKDPWPLASNLPSIVTFYSFKGGVGRTTALVSCAIQLAERGDRVAILDLDLEAPGLGPLLGVDTDRGVLDMIVDHLAVGDVDLNQAYGAPQMIEAGIANRIDVFPAGRLDRGYLEKLARLDFCSTSPWGNDEEIPVHQAMRSLLQKIKKELAPQWIFVDARAGLHDLAGLSLHGLAHADVLVTRASEQAYRGLDVTIRALGQRKSEDRLRCITVHGFAPPDPTTTAGLEETTEMQERVYAMFCEHVYDDTPSIDNDTPSIDDKTGAHWPWPLKRNPNLERFKSIASVHDDLRSQQHQDLLRRIEELCAPDAPKDDA
jgi:MinD-like ATPase involved in chromosome partitioning or flagellar assembly